jgi:alkylation response protein AidB-like acyl-CoA dehydrogenase
MSGTLPATETDATLLSGTRNGRARSRSRPHAVSRPADTEALVESVRKLARGPFAERAADYDARAAFPVENYRDLHAAGLLGLTVPTRYGGHGVDPLTYARCLKEIGRGCSATGLTFNMHATVITILDTLASPEQKQRYFGEVLGQGRLIASITSEPEGGFRDRFSLNTVFRAAPGGAYRIDGVKHFCSLGDAADYYFVTGLLEGATSAHTGIVSAMVPRQTPGVRVEGAWDATGMRGTNSLTIRFGDCLVEQANVVGPPGGFVRADLSRFALGYAAVYLGIAEAAFDAIVEYVRTRPLRQVGEPAAHYAQVQRSVAEMGVGLRTADLLLREAARLHGSEDQAASMLAVNQSKYFSAEVAASVTMQAMRLAGGRGLLKTLPLERWHRDALAGPVMPPANDRCLETIGKLLCGLPAATLEFE